jgi:hypothetical protein
MDLPTEIDRSMRDVDSGDGTRVEVSVHKGGSAATPATHLDHIFGNQVVPIDNPMVELMAIALGFVLGVKNNGATVSQPVCVPVIHLRPGNRVSVTSRQIFEQPAKYEPAPLGRAIDDKEKALGQHGASGNRKEHAEDQNENTELDAHATKQGVCFMKDSTEPTKS